MKEMTLGDLHLASMGQTVHLTDGQSARKTDNLQGTAELFSVTSSEWKLTVAHTRWDNGDQDVRVHHRGTAPPRFDRFRSTRRLGLTPFGGRRYYVDLMQARMMGEDDHPSLRKADLSELSWRDCDVRSVLTKMGAEVGTRELLLGDTSRNRTRYCATFPRSATDVAVVAYVVTRIAPFYHQIRV